MHNGCRPRASGGFTNKWALWADDSTQVKLLPGVVGFENTLRTRKAMIRLGAISLGTVGSWHLAKAPLPVLVAF